jgi:hypothetical protein
MVDKFVKRLDSVEEMNYFNNKSSGDVSQVEEDINNLYLHEIESTEPIPFESKEHYSRNDFEVSLICGKGAYAKVVKAKYIKDNQMKALKIMDKNFLIKVYKSITTGKEVISSLY